MQQNIEWNGVYNAADEYCNLDITPDEISVSSAMSGLSQGVAYEVDYTMKLTPDWQIKSVQTIARLNGDMTIVKLENDGNGKWIKDDEPAPEFDGCMYVDISLTPFTNSLPINHLKIKDGESQIVKVLYFDVMESKIEAKEQKYTRLSETEYKFENVPNDFEVVITVDASGMVVDYPELFKRKA